MQAKYKPLTAKRLCTLPVIGDRQLPGGVGASGTSGEEVSPVNLAIVPSCITSPGWQSDTLKAPTKL